MGNLSKVGCILFGLAIAQTGVQTIWFRKFPYMLIPPHHFPEFVQIALACVFGAFFVVAGVCIVCGKMVGPISLLLGTMLILIFCFYFIPYQFMSGTFKDFGEWENAEKELALCGGGFIIAGCFPGKNENSFIGFLARLIPLGTIFFSLPIICFGIDHFLGPQDVADYTPVWVPFKLFWAYFCGAALIGSGIAILFKIKLRLIASLLGIMIFCWFIMLHIPRVLASPSGGEITSTVIALAYSGIAFVISGNTKKQLPQ